MLWVVFFALWAAAQPAARATLVPQIGHSGSVKDAAFAPDGRLVATASSDGTIMVWDVATGALLRRFLEHEGTVVVVEFSPDGQYVDSSEGGAGAVSFVWEVANGRIRYRLDDHVVEGFSPRGDMQPDRTRHSSS